MGLCVRLRFACLEKEGGDIVLECLTSGQVGYSASWAPGRLSLVIKHEDLAANFGQLYLARAVRRLICRQ